jgi:site-specific recombinase XerD
MMLAKSIRVKRFHHREMDCLGLYFTWDPEIKKLIKSIPGIKYTITHKCWYLPDSQNALRTLFNIFKDKVWLDIRSLKNDDLQRLSTGTDIENPIDEPIAVEVLTEASEAIVDASLHSPEESQKLALEAMRKKLKLKNYSESTLKTYTEQFKLFLQFFPESYPDDLGEQEIEHYLMHLIENRKLSVSTQNQAINAIKFYYEKILKQDRKVFDLERPMKEKRLPEVLSQEEVMAIFEHAGNLKHRTMLMVLYASGLRRSELLNLRVGDIDFDRGVVLIRGGKGRKDRHSVMAQSLMPMVREYLKAYNPKFWMFEGLNDERYSATSLQMVLKRAVKKAGIRKNVRLHMLRHSFATHLLESGTATRYIQILLGHESPKTTEIYAKVTRFGLDKVVSPLDQLAASRQLRGDEEKEAE